MVVKMPDVLAFAVALTAAALILEVLKFYSSDKKKQKELNTAVHSLLLVALLILVKYRPTRAALNTHRAALFGVVVLLSIWAMRWHLQHQQLDHPTSGRREIILVLDWLILIWAARRRNKKALNTKPSSQPSA